MTAIDDIHAKLRACGSIDATEAVIYAQHQIKPYMDELNELRRVVKSLRGIAADAVAAEREACAKIAESDDGTGIEIAAAIRNRT